MSIEAMKLALEALNEAVVFREGGLQKAIDAINALRTAIQQAEATQAEVTDEQIAACVKRASTYGLPFVGLLNPGGTPSDFSKRFTVEILALRHVQVPMTREQMVEAVRPLCQDQESAESLVEICFDEYRAIEAFHNIGTPAQANKETP